jgi:hypothetical protein
MSIPKMTSKWNISNLTSKPRGAMKNSFFEEKIGQRSKPAASARGVERTREQRGGIRACNALKVAVSS